MAEIEEFLLGQFDDAIKKLESSIKKHTDLLKLFNLPSKCRELKDLIEKKAPKTRASLDWVRREKLYCLNTVMPELQMLLTEHHHSTPEILRSAMNLHQRLNQIKKELQGDENAELQGDEKAESVKDGKDSTLRKDSETYRWSSPSVDPTKIHGIEDKVLMMERLLVRKETKNGFRAIGIVGVAGVGKTALCKMAFNNQEVKNHFLPRIWVCLSKQPKEDTDYQKEVVKRILMCLGLEDEIIDKLKQGGLRKLLFALRQRLKGKRYLIVLDDVWNLDEKVQKFCSLSTPDDKIGPEQLAYGLPKGHGGTVIVTSRSREIAEDMVGKKNLHTLLPLANKESCWEIFCDAVKKDGIVPPKELEMIKVEILENCAGLPLVARMMGQIVHEKLQSPGENNQNQTQQETQKPEDSI
ncbi:hypothetical protein CDL12_14852 [Handroanthus impetiginosus]|uniref:AAA+ ATPase domain-containing protein n=1 Tax=Handroanthus impetiginosus TaxID=429701 RepID=A0A2G9H4V1_9LAMI|nr:hypothetical protein CDL12_14852 [Handroanthus impetiginosus]